MKLTFTKIILALFSVLSVGILSAQDVNQMTTTNSNGDVRQYSFGVATFGDGTLLIDAEAVRAEDGTDPVNDACEALVNDVSGRIAVVDRGLCPFADKARMAQAAGSVAVVICNSQIDPNDGVTDISDQIITPTADSADDVTLLVVALSFNDCQNLLLDIESGTTTIAFSFEAVPCNLPDYGPEIIWGANGEGAFNGGLNGWSVDKGTGLSLDDGGWFYDPEARLDRGNFSAPGTTVGSPTECNGAMVFDSDFYDTAGVALGTGICQSNADGVFCEGLLISPEIDLASLAPSGGIAIQWSQGTRNFDSEYFLLLSRDGGTTFSDTIALNTDLVTNAAPTIDTRTAILCDYGTEERFRFAFLYRGSFYHWGIDDVVITEVPATADLRANTFFAIYPCLLYTSPSPRDRTRSRMPSSA